MVAAAIRRWTETILECPTHDVGLPACPVCAGHLIEIRGQLHCVDCHTLCDSVCEGDAWWRAAPEEIA